MKPVFLMIIAAAASFGLGLWLRPGREPVAPGQPALSWPAPKPAGPAKFETVKSRPRAATLLPENLTLAGAPHSLAQAVQHFWEQAARDPAGFAALVKSRCNDMKPELLDAALWALSSHDPSLAVDAATAITAPGAREAAAMVIGPVLPPGDVKAFTALKSRLGVGARGQSSLSFRVFKQWGANDPSWAYQSGRDKQLFGYERSAAVAGLAMADPGRALELLTSPALQFEPHVAGMALAEAANRDLPGALQHLEDLGGAARGHALSMLAEKMNCAVSSRDFDLLAAAVQRHCHAAKCGPGVAGTGLAHLVRAALASCPDKALRHLDQMPKSGPYTSVSAETALALAGNDYSQAWRWTAERENVTAPNSRFELGQIIGNWARADADGLTKALLGNPNAPGSEQMIDALTGLQYRTSPEARRAWLASLPPEIARRVDPNITR